MKKVRYTAGPDYIEVGGLGPERQDGRTDDRMERDVVVEVTDKKAADMLTNPLFEEEA